jgi:DNA-binding CsgD family transcriptional regulator
MMANLQLLAVHAQSAALRLLDGDSADPGSDRHSTRDPSIHSKPLLIPPINLTPREIEVLRWAMDDKSAWATGQILSLSENTVKFHMKGAMRKLQAGSRLQAVLKAIELRII